MTLPAGSGTGPGPKFVMHRQPPGRAKCSAWSLVPGSHSMDSAVCSLRRQLSACRYSDSVDAGSWSCASALTGPYQCCSGTWCLPAPVGVETAQGAQGAQGAQDGAG